MRYLYEDFLTDRAVYSEARRYWESMCLELLGSRASDWEICALTKEPKMETRYLPCSLVASKKP